ncbi:6927_t:CDS:2 [Funneliformis geosporum]|uniref:11706_t:CDS:1 n=1 Tax=Funneliformis geosporum TaxID=1117311 RepID=A0A9W4X333_9GLOM|nr:11706_t:CDS:2 [Funneliformis geosporum]CAI2193038.1 6927_t:CDS:2 [Funneliformis geosporum]
MVRKIRSDKKDTTCDYYSRILANANKLHEHLKRKNPSPSIQESNQQLIQEVIQEPVQIPIQIYKKSDQISESESLAEVKNLPLRNQPATRLADRIDEFTDVKQYRSCDPEVWQERKHIGGHQVQKRCENDGIVGYI